MQAVILAAGDGDRLMPQTADMPKALLPVAGRPIVLRALDALVAAGVDEAVIVIGHHGERVRSALAGRAPAGMTLRFVRNDAYTLGNARSLWTARGLVRGDFMLAMGDHIIDSSIASALADGVPGGCALAVELVAADDHRAGEATRALVDGGRVRNLGKGLDAWNALDTGTFRLTPRVFDVMTPDLRDGEAGDVFATLARAGELDAVDVTGARWIDVDTPADLRSAEAMFAQRADGRVA